MFVFGPLDIAGLEQLSSDPVTNLWQSRVYYNTNDDTVRYYDGANFRSIVSIDQAQIITLKDIDGGTASNTSRITLPKDTSANLASLTDKEGTMAYDTTLSLPVFNNGTDFVALSSAALSDAADDVQNLSLATSVGSNALTIDLKNKGGSDATSGSTIKIAFRNATRATGTYDIVTVSAALTLVVPSTATLGHSSSGSDLRLYVYLINNAGTAELAISNELFDTGTIVSTTVMNTSSDDETVMYSTSARSNVAVRLVGRLISNQATQGLWASSMVEVTPVNIIGGNRPGSFTRATGAAAGAGGFGTVATSIRRFATNLEQVGVGIDQIDGAAAGTIFLVEEDGVYAMSYEDQDSASDRPFGISLNTSETTTNILNITNADRLIAANTPAGNIRGSLAVTYPLRAGDQIRAHHR